jgi:hypothetical protein
MKSHSVLSVTPANNEFFKINPTKSPDCFGYNRLQEYFLVVKWR